MRFAQKALVDEALRARTLFRARRAYVQALQHGLNNVGAFEAAVGALMQADRQISEAEARFVVAGIVEEYRQNRGATR